MAFCFLGERPGSGDGEREASMTRQMPFEPWTPTCAKCGGRIFITSIRVGRRTIIPRATIEHFGVGHLLEERPP